MRELDLVERIRVAAGSAPRPVILGIGDDCAIYRPQPGEDLVATTDFLIEDTHFRRKTHRPEDIGHKALARGLSDIAAMGGSPRFVLVSLAIPKSLGKSWIDRFYDGLLALGNATGTALAGGDLSRAEYIVCDVAVVGAVPEGAALRRDTAKPGDAIYVSGALGGSALGFETRKGFAWQRHLRPEPRLKLGTALRTRYRASAAMDVSDGLSIDLHRMCLASNLAAHLDGGLPLFSGATLQQALHGGEDYELLFTMSEEAPVLRRVAGLPVTRIGTMIKGKPGEVVFGRTLLRPQGFDHFRNP